MLASSISTCNNLREAEHIAVAAIEMRLPRPGWGVMAALLMIRIRMKGSSLWGAMYHFSRGRVYDGLGRIQVCIALIDMVRFKC